MVSRSEDPREPSRWGYALAWTLMAVGMAVAFLSASSCSPRIIEKVKVQRDTLRIVQRDSVQFYVRDSIHIRERGDTIYHYVERWRYRDRVRVDTIVRVKVDSFAVERVKVVEVAKPLTGWQRAQMRGFWWLLGLGLAAVAVWLVKRKLKL